MASYPSQLPLPTQQGYAIQHAQPFTRTEMQSGRARQRRTFTSVPSSVTVSWFFTTQGECQLFEGWFRDDLGAQDGAAWFDMPLQTPLGIYDYQCRFTEMNQGPALVGFDKWQVSASLEIRERPIIVEGEAIITPTDIIYTEIFDITMNREWPAA